MPVGARLEFVATAEGYAPKRVVVPGEVPWDRGPTANLGSRRPFSSIHRDRMRVRMTRGRWVSRGARWAGGGVAGDGARRGHGKPRAARSVWMLAGIAPDARIERLRCDQDIDVLLAGPSTYRNRLRVRAGDFVPDDSPSPSAGRSASKARIARVSAKSRSRKASPAAFREPGSGRASAEA